MVNKSPNYRRDAAWFRQVFHRRSTYPVVLLPSPGSLAAGPCIRTGSIMCTCHEVVRCVYASGSESRDVVLDKPVSGEEALIAARNNLTSLNAPYRWVNIICWSCAADRECLPRGEGADLGFANSKPRRCGSCSGSPRPCWRRDQHPAAARRRCNHRHIPVAEDRNRRT
jgi:hypothetical protein